MPLECGNCGEPINQDTLQDGGAIHTFMHKDELMIIGDCCEGLMLRDATDVECDSCGTRTEDLYARQDDFIHDRVCVDCYRAPF